MCLHVLPHLLCHGTASPLLQNTVQNISPPGSLPCLTSSSPLNPRGSLT